MPASSSASEKSSAALRALSVLETVASSPTPLTATEVNQQLNLPKPTIHRLCMMLEKEGYLQTTLDQRGYVAGVRLSKIALGVFTNNDHLRSQRHAILQRLSDEVGETCNISVPSDGQMLYFDRVETHWPLRVQLQINDRVPMHCTASGKLFLSNLASAKRSRLLSKLSLEQRTPNTIADPEALKKELKKIRREDVGVDNEEFFQGMIAIAVPLRNEAGDFYAALAMHAPTARMSLEQALEQVPKLREAAADLMELWKED